MTKDQLIDILQKSALPGDASVRFACDAMMDGHPLRSPTPVAIPANDTLPEERIIRTAGICGGSARFANTRIPVWTIISALRSGLTEEELLTDYPSLSKPDFLEARNYYESHRQEIDDDIASQDDEGDGVDPDDRADWDALDDSE